MIAKRSAALVALLAAGVLAIVAGPASADRAGDAGAAGAAGRGSHSPPSGDPKDWQLVENLSDEFNGATVDGNKWETPPSWGPWSWDPNNVTQSNGQLNLTLSYDPHTGQRVGGDGQPLDLDLFYKSGIIRSKNAQIFGYYEARIKGVATFPGSSPAFWIYSIDDEVKAAGLQGKAEGDTTYSEIDVVEMEQAEDQSPTERDPVNALDMNLHKRVIEDGKETWERPKANPALQRNKILASFDPREAFHTYGAMVTRDAITWYLDGREVASKPNTSWNELPMHVTLSLGLRYPNVTYSGCPGQLAWCPVPETATGEGYPTTMQVDWVRVYEKKPGTGPL